MQPFGLLVLFFALFQKSIMRLKSLGLTVSHTYRNRKLEEFGDKHDQHIKDSISQQSTHLEQAHIKCMEDEKESSENKETDATSDGNGETENRMSLVSSMTQAVPRLNINTV